MDEMRRAALGQRAEIVAQTRAEAEAQVDEAVKRLDAEAAAARRKLEADAQALGAAAADRDPRTESVIGRGLRGTTGIEPRIARTTRITDLMTRYRLAARRAPARGHGCCCVRGAGAAGTRAGLRPPAASPPHDAANATRTAQPAGHDGGTARARSGLDADHLESSRTSSSSSARSSTSCARRSRAT